MGWLGANKLSISLSGCLGVSPARKSASRAEEDQAASAVAIFDIGALI